MRISDWSSDVCSSDLYNGTIAGGVGEGYNGSMLRASANNHAWYGLVTNYNFDTQNYFTFNVGADIRFSRGDHFQQLVDNLGLEAWNAPNENRGDGDYLVTNTFTANQCPALFHPPGQEHRMRYYNSPQT